MDFNKAKTILNSSKEAVYTDKEIKEILKVLENLKIVFINNQIKSKNNEKRNHLCKSINR
ncbi:hypothetical protein FAQ01_05740 [Flavobacterium aquatile]|jgi:CO dehydrogenase nickel-insertion accessory protein CooC1|nr:hypothetical protein FAQ01_05740 [Flavobacterium aquatile]